MKHLESSDGAAVQSAGYPAGQNSGARGAETHPRRVRSLFQQNCSSLAPPPGAGCLDSSATPHCPSHASILTPHAVS